MIVRDKPTFWELAFVLRGSLITEILPQILAVAAVSTGVVLLDHLGLVEFAPINPLAFTVIGAALAIFSSFRNAAAYDRWWEARKLTGAVVVETRGLAREALAFITPGSGDDLSRRIALRCAAFMYAQRDFLRGRPVSDETRGYLPADEVAAVAASTNPPNRLLDGFSRDIATAERLGRLSPLMAQTLESRVSGLNLAFAGAERIGVTPMPFVYTLLVHRTAYAFCFLLPFGLASSSGFWTPLIAAIVAYTFFGLDAIGDELASPFAPNSANTMPLDAMARAIEITVLEGLGETELPEPLRPKRFLLT